MARNNPSGRTGAAARWAERIERWRGSRLSKLAWCQAHAVSYTQFIRWCKRIEGDASFAPMQMVPISTRIMARGTLTVRLPGALSIEVEGGFDAELLRALVRALSEGAAC